MESSAIFEVPTPVRLEAAFSSMRLTIGKIPITYMNPKLFLPVPSVESTTSSRLRINDSYAFLSLLGRGSFGKVYLAVNAAEKQFAVKSISKELCSPNIHVLRREIAIMKALDHVNLVRFHETYHDQTSLHVVMELAKGRNLSSFIAFIAKQQDSPLQPAVAATHTLERTAKQLFSQIIRAIAYLHSKGIAHRDLKPDNIIVHSTTKAAISTHHVKIIDFGLSRDLQNRNPKSLMTSVGTPLFAAPEMVLNEGYSLKIDVWSIGVLLYHTLSAGAYPFFSDNVKEVFHKIISDEPDFSPEAFASVSNEAKNFIKKLLNKNGKERISCAEALQDSWLRSASNNSEHSKDDDSCCFEVLTNVVAYSPAGKLKREILKVLFEQLMSDEEIAPILKTFEDISTHGGFITASEMYEATKQTNIPITLEQINEVFEGISNESTRPPSNNNQRSISFSDFSVAAIDLAKTLDDRRVGLIFDHLDKNGDGFIGREDFILSFAQEGRKLPELEVQNILEELAENEQTGITKQAFTDFISYEIVEFLKTRASFTSIDQAQPL